tara:strand:- start:635 stop:883 length:249 start_codon:yes stop_codon:yes gene_type:complete
MEEEPKLEIFHSTIRNIIKKMTTETGDKTNKKWENEAIEILHQSTEEYMVDFFKNVSELTKNRNCPTTTLDDIKAYKKIISK